MMTAYQDLIDHRTICDLIYDWSEKLPNKPALLTDDHQSLDYGTLAKRIDAMRVGLNEAGFSRGDRFAIVHPSNARLAVISLGVISAMTAVPLDPALTEDEFAREFQNRGVSGLLATTDTEIAARRAAERLSLPVLDMIWDSPTLEADFHLDGPGKKPPARSGFAKPNDCAVVLGTSGTTDRSKVVPLRQRTLFAQAAASQSSFALTEHDRCINLNPLFLLSGLQHCLASLICGGSAIIVSNFESARFFHILESQRPTWFLGSFTYLKPIIDFAHENRRSIQADQFRFLRVTFSRINKEYLDAVENIFHAPVIEGLGITETGTVASNPLPPGLRKFGTVGLPMSCDIAIIDDTENFLPAGQQGEIVIRGDLVFDGYEGDDAANERAFLDGWYRTGDIGYLDEDNYLIMVGRIKEMINRGGMKISPDELDEALRALPNVLDAASFGIPHPTLGEIPGAAIVWRRGGPGSGHKVFRQALRRRLAPFKVPVGILDLEAIPRGPGGKILRRHLTELYCTQSGALKTARN